MPPKRKVAAAKKQQKKLSKQQKAAIARVKRDTTELEHSWDAARNAIRAVTRSTFEVILMKDGKRIASQQYTRPVSSGVLWYDWFYDTGHLAVYYGFDYENQFAEDANMRFIIKESDSLNVSKLLRQVYRENETQTCLFDPIMDWARRESEAAETQRSKYRYTGYMKRCKEMIKKYPTGIPEEDIQGVANHIQVNIAITKPFQKQSRTYYVQGNQRASTFPTMRFVNTRINHVELNELTCESFIEVTPVELQQIYDKLVKENTYFHYKKAQGVVSQITTLKGRYGIKKDEYDVIHEFERETGLEYCKIDEVQNPALSDFVRQGCHFNETVDFQDVWNYSHKEDDGLCTEFKHMDCEKQYANASKCSLYRGFLGKVTDYRQCNRIEGLGFYKVTDINIHDERLKEYNERMKIYADGRVYPSPELEYLARYATFRIVEGCFGSTIDVDFWKHPRMFEKFTTNMKNKDGEWVEKKAPLYSKYVGQCYMSTKIDKQYVNGTADYLGDLVANLCEEENYSDYYYDSYNSALSIMIEKDFAPHLSHFAGMILGYSRINVLEQLMTMDPSDIIRICVDGIYYTGEYERLNIFRDKPELLKYNLESPAYISEYQGSGIERELPPARDHHMRELHIGPGGNGKTHYNLTDSGFQNILYVPYAWKLSRRKQLEYDTDAAVWATFTLGDPEFKRHLYKKHNVIVFDEVSMMPEQIKQQLMRELPLCKLIFCGDVGFQAPPFKDGEVEMNLSGFDKVIEHLINYRVKCPKLKDVLEQMRDCIKRGDGVTMQSLLHSFRKISKAELQEQYDVNDMILVRSNEQIPKYGRMFKDIPKYMCKARDATYSNGQIVFEKPTVTHEFQHAFTIHAVQGETAENTLYIDIHHMFDPRIIYTAASRARTFDQICLVT